MLNDAKIIAMCNLYSVTTNQAAGVTLKEATTRPDVYGLEPLSAIGTFRTSWTV